MNAPPDRKKLRDTSGLLLAPAMGLGLGATHPGDLDTTHDADVELRRLGPPTGRDPLHAAVIAALAGRRRTLARGGANAPAGLVVGPPGGGEPRKL